MEIKNYGEVEKRLHSFIEDGLDKDQCWEFQGAQSGKGYGRFSINGKAEGAHRVSYAIFHKIKLNGEHICHKCDNPSCINPHHLFAGTRSDNMKDAYRKERLIMPEGTPFKKGHLPKNSEMSLEKAKKVKKHIMDENRQISLKKLAKKYNIKYQTVRDISAGRAYINI